MSLFGAMFRARPPAGAVERIEPTLAQPVAAAPARDLSTASDVGWREWGLGGASRVRSLPRVSPELAQKHATVVAACSIIAGDLAKLPLRVYQQVSADRVVPVHEHPANFLLNVTGSDGVPAHVMRFALGYSFTLRGTAYAYAPRDAAGELQLVEAIRPDRCAVLREGRARFYDFEDGGEVRRRVPARVMAHLRYMADDGWTGRSPIEVAAETLGIALAGQEAAARQVGGKGFKAVAKLQDFDADEEAFQRARARLKQAMENDRDDGVLMIGQSDDIKALGLSAADMQLLDSRRFDREQIAALYRVPPSKLQILEHGVKANGQQQAIDYKGECLTHWGAFIESGLTQGLLSDGERAKGLLLGHDYDSLLAATTRERYEAIKIGVGGPWRTVNEGRTMDGLDTVEGGDVIYPPANMTRQDGAQNNPQNN